MDFDNDILNTLFTTSKCGKYIAKITVDPDNETYVYKFWNGNGAQEINKPKYYIITIYKVDESATETVVHIYKEARHGPSTNAIAKCFVNVNGVMWFIGALNHTVRYFVNCETGKGYTAPAEQYIVWDRIASISPNGTHIIVITYTWHGNAHDGYSIFDISNLDTVGPIEKFITKVPSIFNINYESCIREFTGNSETEIKLSYTNEYDDTEPPKIYDIGIFQLVEPYKYI